MGIGGITPTNNSMSVMQMTSANVKDQKSKSIQNEMTKVQQQMQKLSSDETLTTAEKTNERKKLQREKSDLDTELRRHQEELGRSQKREIRLTELQEEQNPKKAEDEEEKASTTMPSAEAADKNDPSAGEKQALQAGSVIAQSDDGTVILKEVGNPSADEEPAAQGRPAEDAKEAAAATKKPASDNTEPEETSEPVTEFRPTAGEMQAMVSADSSMQQAARLGTLVAKTDDGIAILKSEIKQDDYRGTDTTRKQAELEEMQKQSRRETAFQLSMLDEAGGTMKSAAETDASAKGKQDDKEKNFQVSGIHTAQDEQDLQQGFQVAIA